VEDISGHSNTEQTDGTMWGTDRQWNDWKTSVDTVTQNQGAVQCEVLTDSGVSVEDSSGHSDTESTDGTLWGTDRLWTDSRRQHWT